MEKNCYICDLLMTNGGVSILKTRTRYSELSIFQLLNIFTGREMNASENCSACQNCLDKLNRYDLACSIARKIQLDLVNLLTCTEEKHVENVMFLNQNIMKDEKELDNSNYNFVIKDYDDSFEKSVCTLNTDELVCVKNNVNQEDTYFKIEKDDDSLCSEIENDKYANKSRGLIENDEFICIKDSSDLEEKVNLRNENIPSILNHYEINSSLRKSDQEVSANRPFCEINSIVRTSKRNSLLILNSEEQEDEEIRTLNQNSTNNIQEKFKKLTFKVTHLSNSSSNNETVTAYESWISLDNVETTSSKQNESKYINKQVRNLSKKDRQHFCHTCKKKFTSLKTLRDHINDKHQSNRFICDICGASYKMRSALNIHIGLHNGISPYECEACGKKFTQKGALKRHQPIHTGERPYECSICDKKFIHYSSYHMHKLAHADIRKKKCELCGLGLRSNSHLKRHMLVHTGLKPHQCSVCGQRFAQKYNMMSHLRSHQGIHRQKAK